jgi:hypothetical protein
MEPNQGIKGWQWFVTVVVIIILVVLGYYMYKGTNSKSPSDTNSSVVDNNESTSKEINRVDVTDQYPGNLVYISSAQFAAPGWVVIHKDNNGKPGDIIGYTYFDKGINPGRVNLKENTKEGMMYYAMLHSDDGDKKFDASKDAPLKDSKGNIIMKLFRATSSVTEIKG